MLRATFKGFQELTRLGVEHDVEDERQRRIVFSNIVYLCLPIVYIVFILIDFDSYLYQPKPLAFDQLIVPFEILICVVCLLLNKYHQDLISRVIFLGTWPLVMQVIPVALLHAPADYFFAYPSGIIFHALLIQLLISHKSERVVFWVAIALNFTAMCTAANYLAWANPDPYAFETIINNKYYIIDGITYWLLINLIIFYTIHVLDEYLRAINNAKILIEAQKEELAKINQNLETWYPTEPGH